MRPIPGTITDPAVDRLFITDPKVADRVVRAIEERDKPVEKRKSTAPNADRIEKLEEKVEDLQRQLDTTRALLAGNGLRPVLDLDDTLHTL